jgi:alpha-1,2-mannosyltransferase
MALILYLTSSILGILIIVLFSPIVLRFIGEITGSWLRRSSRSRRELLLARVATEQRSYEAEERSEEKKLQDDWEEIERAAVGNAVNGGKAEQDFSGVVGFFHPFWQVWPR